MNWRLRLYAVSIELRRVLASFHRSSFQVFIAPSYWVRRIAQAGLTPEDVQDLDARLRPNEQLSYGRLQQAYDTARTSTATSNLTVEPSSDGLVGLDGFIKVRP